jgi:aspartate/methionine/tyrosine aminotransferase
MNPNLAEVPPSLIRSINARKRPGDIDLGLGEPTLPPDIEAFSAALDWTRRNGSPYSPNAGFPELREAIASYLAGLGWAAGSPTAQEVCVTVGSEEALFLAVKTVIDPARDEVLIVEPCYLAYPKICLLEGIRHRLVRLDPVDGFVPRAAAILDALRPDTRLVIINSPSNPTGRVWAAEELETLASGLRRQAQPVLVLADEVYRELYYGSDPPVSIARFHPHTLVAGSLSKSNAVTGLRIGWLAGPAEVIAGATKVHQFVNTAATTFSQRVALALFERTGALGAHRPIYRESRDRLLAAVAREGLEMVPPEGAFYGFVRLPQALAQSSLVAAESLLDRSRVVAVPGLAFGASGEGWLRLSWVGPAEVVEEGIVRIGQWMRQAADRVGR